MAQGRAVMEAIRDGSLAKKFTAAGLVTSLAPITKAMSACANSELMSSSFEYLIVDFHHRPGASARRRGEKREFEDQALRRSRGGLSTKIHLAVRGLGCPVRFTLTAGQKGDAPQASALIEGLPAGVLMADTAYDADHLRQAIAAKGALAVIPNSPSRVLKYPLDKHLYA